MTFHPAPQPVHQRPAYVVNKARKETPVGSVHWSAVRMQYLFKAAPDHEGLSRHELRTVDRFIRKLPYPVQIIQTQTA